MQGRQWMRLVLLAVMLFLGAACGSHEVRHLASDACLVVPGRADRQEVIGLLGFPDKKETRTSGEEVWYYVENNQSRLRRTPYLGKWMGSEEYDVLFVTFRGDEVTACVYRNLTPEEFQRLGIEPVETDE